MPRATTYLNLKKMNNEINNKAMDKENPPNDM